MQKAKDTIYEISEIQIKNLIKLSRPKLNDVFYDFGSGSGKVTLIIVKHVKKSVGIELEKKYHRIAVRRSNERLNCKYRRKIEYWLGEGGYLDNDGFVYDISDATIVYNSLCENENEVMYYKYNLKDDVKIIKKDLPLVGYKPVNVNRDSTYCWFFLMKTPLFKHRIYSKKKWAEFVLGKHDVTINDVYHYYLKQWKRRGDDDNDINDLKKLVRKRLPRP